MPPLTIGEIARRAGVAASALRYYEQEGLLAAPPRVCGQRRYEPTVLKRLAVIRMAQEAGFTIAEIRTLFSGFVEDAPASERWKDLARHKIPEVDAMIRRMQAGREVLEESLRCDCLTLDACADLGWGTCTVTHRPRS